MTKRRLFLVFTALAAVAVAFAFSRKTAPKPAELSVQFTSGIRGRLVPCGCFSGQMGGLTRISTLFQQLPAKHVLRLDAGDAIEGSADFQRLGHVAILKAFAEMNYAAANIGHREAQLSLAQLREVRGKSAVPLISANLLDAATRQPVFETHVLLNAPARIAVVGVVDPRGLSESLGDGLAVEKMETVLSNLLPKLKQQADFIVLLAFTDEATLHALAREFYEIDVILGGNVSQPAQKLERENRSVILYTANQSRAVGSLALQLTAPHQVKTLSGEVILVSDKIAEDPKIVEFATAYRAEVRRTKLDLDDPANLGADMVPGVKAGAAFAGSEACLGCHAAAAGVWKESHHSRAFATLVRREADADPNCIGCHTVGFGLPGGYLRSYGAEKLTNVGCESCHGPGSQHVAERARGVADGAKFRRLGAGDCQKCHHGEFSRPFDHATFWPLIRHSK